MNEARQAAGHPAQATLSGPISARDLRDLPNRSGLISLNIERPKLTERMAAGLSGMTALRELRLWCEVTRTAMRHVLPLPELRTLDVFCLKGPGKLAAFEANSTL